MRSNVETVFPALSTIYSLELHQSSSHLISILRFVAMQRAVTFKL